MQRTLGIDLGTTNSVMAYMRRSEPHVIINRDNSDLTPSVVARGRSSELLVGRSAKAYFVRGKQDAAAINSIKRFMGRKFADPDVQKVLKRLAYRVTEGPDGDVRVWLGGREYTPIEISSIILKRLKDDAESRESTKFTRAVITVPAYFKERQVAATLEAGRMAGFQVLRILNEPTAAALAYGLNREQPSEASTILVYDLGGGTFDISILLIMQGAINGLGIEGDNLLGGDDFDDLIMTRVFAETQRQEGVDLKDDPDARQKVRLESEQCKIRLSTLLSTEIEVPAVGPNRFDISQEISRDEFERMVRPGLEQTIALTQKAIRDANLTPDVIDHILLVGGSTSIPLVETLLKQVFGERKIRRNVNPMQGVAVGAAIQASLISEIECAQCHTLNPISLDNCVKCGGPLYGAERISCPVCFVPCETTLTTCWKCNSALTVTGGSPPPPPRKTCPTCGKPYAPGETLCSICDQGGLKCPNCEHLNKQGAYNCAQCGFEILAPPNELTAQPFGIETIGGKIRNLIDKGTPYPTTEPKMHEFKTAAAGQRRLEIAVYEGDDPTPQLINLCGVISVALPAEPPLPQASPVDVGLGLDNNRTITVVVKIRALNKTVQTSIKRGVLKPELQRTVHDQREKLTKFIDRWREELTDAEQNDLLALLTQLDNAINDAASLRQPLESVLARSDQLLTQVMRVRGIDARVSNFLFATSKYLTDENRRKVADWISNLGQARAHADWAAASTLADEIDSGLDDFSGNLHIIAHSRTWAVQNKLSPALRHRVMASLTRIDDGIDKNQSADMEQGMQELLSLWPEVRDEINNSAPDEIGPTLLRD